MFRGITWYKVVAVEEKMGLVQDANIVITIVGTVESITYCAMCTSMQQI